MENSLESKLEDIICQNVGVTLKTLAQIAQKPEGEVKEALSKSGKIMEREHKINGNTTILYVMSTRGKIKDLLKKKPMSSLEISKNVDMSKSEVNCELHHSDTYEKVPGSQKWQLTNNYVVSEYPAGASDASAAGDNDFTFDDLPNIKKIPLNFELTPSELRSEIVRTMKAHAAGVLVIHTQKSISRFNVFLMTTAEHLSIKVRQV